MELTRVERRKGDGDGIKSGSNKERPWPTRETEVRQERG